MRQDEIIELIQKGEGETVEFKEGFDRKTVETASAFANTKGGTIFIGITDKGKIKGISLGIETLRNWANQISQASDPRIIPEIDHAEIRGKKVVNISRKNQGQTSTTDRNDETL